VAVTATVAVEIDPVGNVTVRGHLRKYDACWPNDRFLIRKRPLGEVPANDRFWPKAAIGAQASLMTARGSFAASANRPEFGSFRC